MTGVMLAALTAVLIRQIFVLAAVLRSRTFLARKPIPTWTSTATRPKFFIVLPVLRETVVIEDTIAHMERLAEGHLAQVVVVTTEREAAEASMSGRFGGTVALVEKLAAEGNFVHLHYPDPHGLKGDQLNFAGGYCASTLLEDVPADRAFVVCYDADSRPPRNSLRHFEDALCAFETASVFHQSSRFELRDRNDKPVSLKHRLDRLLCDGGALRANRFVLGFEIPRLLNRSARARSMKRKACSYVYAHVTGHGLCIRLSLLLSLPFPSRSPLEDMQYSFYLGSRDLPMVAIPSLDGAAVPDSVAAQVNQASRWFFGPARALRYLRNPMTQPGRRATLQAMSALASAGEWLFCAILPPSVCVTPFVTGGLLRAAALAVATIYLIQLIVTERALGTQDVMRRRVLRIVACPTATVLFGIGGFVGVINVLRGGSGVGKTERR